MYGKDQLRRNELVWAGIGAVVTLCCCGLLTIGTVLMPTFGIMPTFSTILMPIFCITPTPTATPTPISVTTSTPNAYPTPTPISITTPTPAHLTGTLKGHTNVVHSVAFSPDGRTLASGAADGAIILWDVATGERLRTLQGHADMVLNVAFSPDGRTLASASEDGTIILWDVSDLP